MMYNDNKNKPNVIIVITDDQGYGDLGCTGNPWIKTPNINRFYAESARFVDFHVQPLCTPTRGAIMTGRRPVRTGAWATCWGRSILNKEETTMADIFKANGYRTGLFGKWHLGDNYPYRPFDRGFEHVVAHHGGGVGQTPDFWGNNYFDDTYFHNGQAREHRGYCTDIWFEEAIKFIEKHRNENFFSIIATNAPHAPYLVSEKYTCLYKDNPDIPEPAFYAMISNIDENFGKLNTELRRLGIWKNTIVIFMTDNGSSGGVLCDHNGFASKGFNARMRGKKGSYYEGGHRVPFFIRWPRKNICNGSDVNGLWFDMDILPSLVELCSLKRIRHKPFDGKSFANRLTGEKDNLSDRINFINIRQSHQAPEKTRGCVLTRKWRLINGSELYDIENDPEQHENVADKNPEVVKFLKNKLDHWWTEISPGLDRPCCISLGNETENPVKLTAMDVMGDVAWNQAMIIKARHCSGIWNVDIEKAGRYKFSLRRWPGELPVPIWETVSKQCAERTASQEIPERIKIRPIGACMEIFDQELSKSVDPESESVDFEVDIQKTGPTILKACFLQENKQECGAYYVYVEKVECNI